LKKLILKNLFEIGIASLKFNFFKIWLESSFFFLSN